MTHELYISVDIEASGPIPGHYSLVSIGACVVTDTTKQFYAEVRPISDAAVPEAMSVIGKTLEDFRRHGRDPATVMAEFEAWLKGLDDGPAVFVGFNAAFDWSFVNWYFHKFLGRNPFGIGGVDIKSFLMGHAGCAWQATRSSRLPTKYRAKGARHSHHALEDAIEQANIFELMARDAGLLRDNT